MIRILFLLLMISFNMFSQQENDQYTGTIKVRKKALEKDMVSFVKQELNDRPPSFIGGHRAMLDYINKSMRYPFDALQSGVDGEVTLEFVIDVSGELKLIKPVEFTNEVFVPESVRILKQMPNWLPEIKNGVPQACTRQVTIVFSVLNYNRRTW